MIGQCVREKSSHVSKEIRLKKAWEVYRRQRRLLIGRYERIWSRSSAGRSDGIFGIRACLYGVVRSSRLCFDSSFFNAYYVFKYLIVGMMGTFV